MPDRARDGLADGGDVDDGAGYGFEPRDPDPMAWRLMNASLLEWVALIVILLLGAWAISWMRNRFREDEDPAGQHHEMLQQFGDLHRGGDLTDDEYRLIKSRLVGQLDRALQSEQSKPSPANADPSLPAPAEHDSTNSIHTDNLVDPPGEPSDGEDRSATDG